MLVCPSCKLGNMKLTEGYVKINELASCLLFQCIYFLEENTSISNDNSFDIPYYRKLTSREINAVCPLSALIL